jgi:hypothetical protein
MDNSCLATAMFMKEVDIVLTMGSSCIAILPVLVSTWDTGEVQLKGKNWTFLNKESEPMRPALSQIGW